MKTNSRNKRGFTLVELLVVIVIIASLAGLSTPMIMGQIKKAARTQATSNAKQIGIAMFTFDQEYGSFPDSSTKDDVDEIFDESVIKGDAGQESNGYFKQLLQAGIVPSEEIFFAKANGTREPDGDMSTDAKALEKREVGFGYVLVSGDDGESGMSTSGNPSRILVITPLAKGSADEFDGDPFDKQAVALKIDQSAVNLQISVPAGTNKGSIKIGGQDFATAEVWNGETPVIKPPDI